MYFNCAFSGHRNLNGGGFDDGLLERVILDLVKCGAKNFYCGMALGFDLAAAEKALALKREYDIRLIACLPCGGQEEPYPKGAKARYAEILKSCDEVITLAPEYYDGCMHRRNRFMVERCDALVCYLRKRGGGTDYTVKYAESCGKKIIYI